MPVVSVVIPTFNRSGFIIEAIESVYAQTFGDFDVIVVDDGSNDGTAEIVSEKFPLIEVIIQKNRGVSAARNVGINHSKGKYIAFLDSDDLWLPEKLQAQVDFFRENPDISICQTEELWIRNGKRVNPKNKHKKHSGWIFKECIPLCIVSPSAVMIKREVFEKIGLFDEELPACEDYDLWLRAALQYEIITLPEPLIIKKGGHEDQLSKQWGLDKYRVMALLKILDDPNLSLDERKDVIFYIQQRCKILENGYLKRGKDAEARKFRELSRH
ncbi:MAG: glycosyltransferase [Syntrophaceae bacterium]|nr:glycosyltransferase [Syntrophaceae bacterium]